MIRPAVLAVCAVAFTASCTQEQISQNRVPLGAAAGAALGAGVGLLFGGNDRRNALIGAGVGALAGAAAGNFLLRQEQELNEDLAGTGATVVNTGDALLVTMPYDVTFAFGSASLKPEFAPTLTEFAETLRRYPESFVDVIGHTDNVGSAEFNQRLSEQRAQTVADFLIGRGVIRERVVSYGFGLTQPIASNATEEGRARNRRVEIKITPFTQGA
jgi:outer membrane protein OmpA-like peptidoglycan-associated protein